MAEKYTVAQFNEAIPGTGGIISAVASKVGCDWHIAKKYIDNYPTIKQVWDDERSKITDKARHNIIKAINGGDLQMSKWWLQVMDEDFIEKQRTELTGKDGEGLKIIVRLNDENSRDND
jgi:hypothetical protein